tara:strand:+ start:829 stop:1053 length:225 start_codon:yes stop_codon:yes gene_type:complete
VRATSIIGTVARPSRPSVKLTALEEPIITKTIKGIKNIPKFKIKFLKNGKYNSLRYGWSVYLKRKNMETRDKII